MCIFRHVNRAILDRRVNKRTFAISVVEHYHASVPAELRTVQFIVAGDPHDAAKTNAKHIFRFDDELVPARLPADLEESLVMSLPAAYRTECLRDLCGRYGLLAVDIASVKPGQDLANVGRIASQAGQVLGSMAPIIGDGRIDQDDLDQIPKAMDELQGLMSVAASVHARLLQVLNTGK